MELVDKSLLKGFSGKVDGMIIYNVGKKTYARKKPEHVHDPKTEKQMRQRAKFPAIQAFYQSVKMSVLKDVFDVAAREEEKRSGYHLFMHLNIRAFDKDNFIDYSLLHLSSGCQQLAYSLELVGVQGNRVEFSWSDNTASLTAQASDRLMVATVFDEDPYRAVVLDDVNAVRGDCWASVALPGEGWKNAHLYCFFGTEDRKRFSASKYFKITRG